MQGGMSPQGIIIDFDYKQVIHLWQCLWTSFLI